MIKSLVHIGLARKCKGIEHDLQYELHKTVVKNLFLYRKLQVDKVTSELLHRCKQ